MNQKEMTAHHNSMKHTYIYSHICVWALVGITMVLCACSSTKNIPEDDQLYTGLTKIKYVNYEKNDHFIGTQEEIEAALACAPNGALFCSIYYRTPFQFSLLTWNDFANS